MIEWAKDNDQDVYIEGLPSGLSLDVFVSTSKLQTATAVSGLTAASCVYGTYDIPATATTPARTGVACYKAPFEGDAITANAAIDTPLYLIVREGQNIRRYAELYVRENAAATAN